MGVLLYLLSWALAVRAADIDFFTGSRCDGKILYGGRGIENIACYNLSDFDRARSIEVSSLGADQQVELFTDTECLDKTRSITTDQCYPDSEGSIKSFLVSTNPDSVGSSTDIEPYSFKLSNGVALALEPDIRYSNLIIGVALGTAAAGITFYNAVNSCSAIRGDPSPPTIIACIGGPIASVISAAGAYFFARQGQHVNQAINLADGSVTNIKQKRETIDDLNYNFLSSAMTEVSGIPAGVHVGYMQRDDGFEGNETSPLYELDFAEFGKWHLASFFDESLGDFVHHMHSAEETHMAKRSTAYHYDTIRWGGGGFDFHFCRYHSGSGHSGWSTNHNEMFRVAYDQLTCSTTAAQLKRATHAQVDMYNENSVLIGELSIKAYYGARSRVTSCSTKYAPLNQDCFIS